MSFVEVNVAGAISPVKSLQCKNCDYFEFEPDSSKKVINELAEQPLKIKHKIIKLSQDRLGMYFNRDIIRCLNLKKGGELLISVPDKKHILIEISEN